MPRHRAIGMGWLLLPLSCLLFACGEKSAPSTDKHAPSPGVAMTQDVQPAKSPGGGIAPAPVRKLPTKPLLRAPLAAELLEEAPEALAIWREVKDQRPVLLLLAAKSINAVPDAAYRELTPLLASAPRAELQRRSASPVADMLLTADMGIGAALRSGLFSRVVWVVPVAEGSGLPFDVFNKQLHERALGWGEQLDSFRQNGELISGQLDGVPVDVTTIDRLPTIAAPVVAHIDSGFFKAYYNNEIKTPLFPTVVALLNQVAAKGYQALAVTVAQNNVSGELPLTTRFLGRELVAIFADPTILEKPTVRLQTRGDILYLENFFQKEMMLDKYRQLVEMDKDDASAFYGTYLVLREQKRQDEALAALAHAVAIDRVYADEYMALADLAQKKGLPDKVRAMVEKAAQGWPENVFYRLRLAQVLGEQGKKAEADKVLQQLRKEPWSPVYYPQMLQQLDALSGR